MSPDTMQYEAHSTTFEVSSLNKKTKNEPDPVKSVELNYSLQEMWGDKLSNTTNKQRIQKVGHSIGQMTWFSQQNNSMEGNERKPKLIENHKCSVQTLSGP